jgi:hypothetical protein
VRLRPMNDYTLGSLTLVVERFKGSHRDLEAIFKPIADGFKVFRGEDVLGTIKVIEHRAVFDPPLPARNSRADGVVAEADIRSWIQIRLPQ